MSDHHLQPKTRVLMMPRDTNASGTIFGGVILSYIDQAGRRGGHLPGGATRRHRGHESGGVSPTGPGRRSGFVLHRTHQGRADIGDRQGPRQGGPAIRSRTDRRCHRSRDHLCQRRWRGPADPHFQRRRGSGVTGDPIAAGSTAPRSRRFAPGCAPGLVAGWLGEGEARATIVAVGDAVTGCPSTPVTSATWFDLASLTKPLVVGTLSSPRTEGGCAESRHHRCRGVSRYPGSRAWRSNRASNS